MTLAELEAARNLMLVVFALAAPLYAADIIALIKHIWNALNRAEQDDNGAVRRDERRWE